MTKAYVVLIRTKAGEKDYPYAQRKSQVVAEDLANTLYKKHQLDMVAVVEGTTFGHGIPEQYNIVYTCERGCKHPEIEFLFDFFTGQSIPTCSKCGQKMKRSTLELEEPEGKVDDVKTSKALDKATP